MKYSVAVAAILCRSLSLLELTDYSFRLTLPLRSLYLALTPQFSGEMWYFQLNAECY